MSGVSFARKDLRDTENLYIVPAKKKPAYTFAIISRAIVRNLLRAPRKSRVSQPDVPSSAVSQPYKAAGLSMAVEYANFNITSHDRWYDYRNSKLTSASDYNALCALPCNLLYTIWKSCPLKSVPTPSPSITPCI